MDRESIREVSEELKEKIKSGKTWEMTENEFVSAYIFLEATELERRGEIENASEVFELVEERESKSDGSEDDATDILKQRFAKGEISEEEFKNKKEIID